ncbi:hypothetical protein ElyMa_004632100 [Elysia marginata]|uniref:Uncharacterized protein n=1 Tax=Elysia marginata TaxID=1093978 RepID=A0AAV4HZK9_9GAST|nr:hypothetical protein ElyMa_004632100 [Elysia marginata]
MLKVKREGTRVGISKSLGRVDSPLASLSVPTGSEVRRTSKNYDTSAGNSRLRAVLDPDMTRAWSVEALAPPPGMVTSGRPLGKKRFFRKPNSMEGSWQLHCKVKSVFIERLSTIMLQSALHGFPDRPLPIKSPSELTEEQQTKRITIAY